jgi:hypothetical protein
MGAWRSAEWDPCAAARFIFEARHSSGYSILLIDWGSKLQPMQSVQSQRLRAVQLGAEQLAVAPERAQPMSLV